MDLPFRPNDGVSTKPGQLQYRELGADYYDRRHTERLTRRAVQTLEQQGLPPAEFEQAYYDRQAAQDTAAVLT